MDAKEGKKSKAEPPARGRKSKKKAGEEKEINRNPEKIYGNDVAPVPPVEVDTTPAATKATAQSQKKATRSRQATAKAGATQAQGEQAAKGEKKRKSSKAKGGKVPTDESQPVLPIAMPQDESGISLVAGGNDFIEDEEDDLLADNHDVIAGPPMQKKRKLNTNKGAAAPAVAGVSSEPAAPVPLLPIPTPELDVAKGPAKPKRSMGRKSMAPVAGESTTTSKKSTKKKDTDRELSAMKTDLPSEATKQRKDPAAAARAPTPAVKKKSEEKQKSAKKTAAKKEAKPSNKIARGKQAKSQAFKGKKEKTAGGLKKDDLKKSKAGKVVSKKKSKQGEESKWIAATVEGRKFLGIEGFCPMGGKTKQGKA
ncbi:unnamed protein product [Amoebophrya sp. A120]|nr:unnamed protein product [Amoebophrya sp. A120]|eukprot:GSA120T00000945001.1